MTNPTDKLSPQTKSVINVIIGALAAYTAFDLVYVGIYHQAPLLGFVEVGIGVLAGVLSGLAAYTHFKHHPVL